MWNWDYVRETDAFLLLVFYVVMYINVGFLRILTPKMMYINYFLSARERMADMVLVGRWFESP